MDLHLKGKVIIVTGGARGIGKGICQVLANEGAIVAIIGRTEEHNIGTVDEISKTGTQAFQVTADLTVPANCEKAINTIGEKFGSIYGVVNNAGMNDGVGLEHGDYESFMSSLHKNLVHYYLVAHHALPYLIKSRGAIVNISSKTAETGQGGTSAYAAANGGRNAMTREWAVELLKYSIRVNAIIVAESMTPMYESWLQTMQDPEEKLNEINARIPLGHRMTTVEEIANMAAFLLSDQSSHTTGQLVHVDGGYTHLDRAVDTLNK